MPARESSIAARLRRKLKYVPRTSIKKFHSDAKQRDVDVLIVTHGFALFFELKRPGAVHQAKDWQNAKLRKWAKSAKYCGVSDDVDFILAKVQEVAREAELMETLLIEYKRREIYENEKRIDVVD